MLRSLFSGVSGMKNNQTKMDVIGNNIANVNTTAFKAGRVRFQDIFSQTIKQATASNAAGNGGTNPRQVGLGMQVAGIDTLTNQGGTQPTGIPLDLAIDNGDGYFVVCDGDDITTSNVFYTRDGSFTRDDQGNIVNSDGYKLMGYRVTDYTTTPITYDANNALKSLSILQTYDKLDASGNVVNDASGNPIQVKLNNFSIESNGTIKGVMEDGSVRELGIVSLAQFKNPAGLSKVGGNKYIVSPNSGAAVYSDNSAATKEGMGNIIQGALEMSNVDLASEFTDMIITSRAFQANSRTITTSDEMLQELLNLKR